jgi:hypothetical protein
MIDYANPSTDDIVIPKGLRMNHQPTELIIQKPGEDDGKIVIPYGTDLTNLETRLTTLESNEEGSSYTPVIPEDFNKYTPFYPTSFSNDSFFNFFRGNNPGSPPLGVLVTTNNNEYNQPLFQINKTNFIRIGSTYLDSTTKELKLETARFIIGAVGINNYSGLTLVNTKDSASTTILINHTNNVSFMKYYTTPNNTTDIVLAKDFRTSVTDNEVVFHKPGDTITNKSSPSQVIICYNTDLINYNKTTFVSL